MQRERHLLLIAFLDLGDAGRELSESRVPFRSLDLQIRRSGDGVGEVPVIGSETTATGSGRGRDTASTVGGSVGRRSTFTTWCHDGALVRAL